MPDLSEQPPAGLEYLTRPPVRRRGFRDGWMLSRHTAARLLARPELVLVVLALASVEFFTGDVLLAPTAHVRTSLKSPARSVAANRTILTKWAQPYRKDLAGNVLLGSAVLTFEIPLFYPATAFTPPALEYLPYFHEGRGAPASHAFIATCGFLAVAGILFLPVYICLLGCIRDAQQQLRLAACSRYLRESYWPMAKGMVIFFGVAFASLLAAGLIELAVTLLARGHFASTGRLGYLAFVCIVPLTLAPFAIVAHRMGTRQGIAEGWRLLRANWPAMLVLFIVVRVASEVVDVCKLLAPWPLTNDAGWLIVALGPAAWSWATQMMEVLLALWLAYAFMEIATETPAAVAEASSR
jgi:hypothetical protein